MERGWHYAAELEVCTPKERWAAWSQGAQEFVMFRISWEQEQWHVSFHDHSASTFEDPGCITTAGMLLAHSGYLPIQEQQ